MELDEDQEAVVNGLGQQTLVLAGAGSGKTRVLVGALARILENGCRPQEAMLLTFTRRAAEEMRTRAEEAVGHDLADLYAGTFHSVLTTLLREAGQVAQIIDQEEALVLLEDLRNQVLLERDEMELDSPGAAELLELFASAAEEELQLEDLLDEGRLRERRAFVLEIAQRYRQVKDTSGRLDYSDCLTSGLRLLLDHQFGQAFIASLRAVLVDEAQDLNRIQRHIIKTLAQGGAQTLLVGDASQSIYGWRGASVSALEQLAKDDQTTLFHLPRNYRSRPEIVSFANIIVRDMTLYMPSKAVRASGGSVRRIATHSGEEEAEMARLWALERLECSDPQDLAILARAHHHLPALRQALYNGGLPVSELGRYSGPLEKVRQLLVQALALGENHQDYLALAALLTPAGKMPPLGQVQLILRDRGLAHFRNEAELVEPLGQMLDLALADLEPSERWQQLCLGPGRGLAHELVGNGADDLIVSLLELGGADVLQRARETHFSQERQGLALGTIHAAKGLEWKHVLVARIGPSSFPLTGSGSDSDEERRLFYVACTRAAETLTLSDARWLRPGGYLHEAEIVAALSE